MLNLIQPAISREAKDANQTFIEQYKLTHNAKTKHRGHKYDQLHDHTVVFSVFIH